MKSTNIALKLNSIVYDNIDTTVLVHAVSQRNHLSREMQMLVSFSELNQLISELQRSNPDSSLTDLFLEEKITSSYTQYTFQAESLKNRSISIDQNQILSIRKEIRA